VPSSRGEVQYSSAANGVSFGGEQIGFHLGKAAESAEAASGCDNAMVRQARLIGQPHDLTDCARGARTSRQARDVPVGHDPARWNPPQHMQHSSSEDRGRGSNRHAEPLF